jgi:hypothetical protein
MAVAAAVPWFVWLVVVGADLSLIALLVLAVRRHGGPEGRRRAMGVGLVLAAWFVLAAGLSAAGVFVSGPTRPPAIGLGLFPPILVGALALAFSRTARDRALAIPQSWLVAIQSLRAVGVVFLVLLARGVLPPQFALPAGWGDIAVGVSAPLVAHALSKRKPWAPPVAIAWNVLGLVDLAVAVGTGALSADSSVRQFMNPPSTDAMAVLPLSLVPVFAVPIFVLLHVTSLVGLRSRARHRAGEAGILRDADAPRTLLRP